MAVISRYLTNVSCLLPYNQNFRRLERGDSPARRKITYGVVMATNNAELLLGRIKMSVSSCLTDVAGYIPGSIYGGTEIPDEHIDELLAKLSELFEKKITRGRLGSKRRWSVEGLSSAICNRQNEFPSISPA